jgi:hypothetical protein
MHPAIVAILFLLGIAVGILSSMFAVEKRLKWPYLIPVAFGIGVAATTSIATGEAFDTLWAIFLSSSSLILGWAQVLIDPNRPKR